MNKIIAIAFVATLSHVAYAAEAGATKANAAAPMAKTESPPTMSEAERFAKCGAELNIGADGHGILVVSKCDLAKTEQQN